MNVLLHAVDLCSPGVALLFGILSVSLLPLRRDKTALRLFGCAAGVALVIALILFIPENRPFTKYVQMGYYYLVYLAVGLSLVVCCEGTVYDVAYVAVIGQLWQHFLFSLSSIVFEALALFGRAPDTTTPAVTVGVFLAYALAYLLMHLLLKRYFRSLISLVGNPEILAAGLLLPVPLDTLNLLILSLELEHRTLLYFRIYSCLICIAAYLMLLSLQRSKVTKLELYRIREASLRQKERYEFKKEVIDRVNIRAHDLKKQLGRMEAAGALLDKRALDEVRRELSAYDELVDTGNEVLNLILSDAVGRCREAEIRFTYLLDGAALGFVDALDLYAIFGNLLDNAITAASAVSAPERRLISLKMSQVGEMLYIHLFNTFETPVRFHGAFPKTTKRDAENHGFGMKSVSSSIKKYGGEMRVSAEDAVFNVTFMLRKG